MSFWVSTGRPSINPAGTFGTSRLARLHRNAIAIASASQLQGGSSYRRDEREHAWLAPMVTSCMGYAQTWADGFESWGWGGSLSSRPRCSTLRITLHVQLDWDVRKEREKGKRELESGLTRCIRAPGLEVHGTYMVRYSVTTTFCGWLAGKVLVPSLWGSDGPLATVLRR
ncbi:hypothetical protein TEQG_02873 [Trichophyton equinum CBS 127.97]|uniref:Uncharacterized protein n=1 Tax=Trichophyton equinum (strain ATCC MYA-4606 / CBS 127.97) TaxID=559882 RepID=F2PPM1_TRIEC|nr:hypothetical protein TEQG_02873 [Trichophyton equinum CBS 127.97]